MLPPVKSNCKFTALKIADAVWRPNLGLKTRKTLALFAEEKQKKKEEILTWRKLRKEVLFQLSYILGCGQLLQA